MSITAITKRRNDRKYASPSNAETPEVMTMRDLSTLSGVPVRRIRFYIAEGLLAPPVGQGRAAHYLASHLARLRKIQGLRQANIGLDEIGRQLGKPGMPMASYTWRRWEILPGIEIHVREDLAPGASVLVSQFRTALATRERAESGQGAE